jgi:16S rRNA processing protein RimM
LGKLVIATVGKTFGFNGFLKLHIHSDFIEQFHKKSLWQTSRGELEIEEFDLKKSLVKFRGFNSLEDAKKLVHTKLFSTEEESRELCELDEGEFFWFDIFGLSVVEDGEILGAVKEIERIAGTDYLIVETSAELQKKRLPKSFLVPYLDRYILDVNLEERAISTTGAKEILEAS